MNSHKTPEGYNEHDYQKLVAFLEQTDNEGVKNGEKLSDNYDPADPTTWGACVWRKGRLFRFEPQGYITTLVGALDLSGCALRDLYCGGNNLTELNVSGCTRLEEITCGGNKLTGLNVSGCTRLVALNCVFNNLITLDVSDCAELEELWCGGNKLTELNVNCCTELKLYDTIVKDGVITEAKR